MRAEHVALASRPSIWAGTSEDSKWGNGSQRGFTFAFVTLIELALQTSFSSEWRLEGNDIAYATHQIDLVFSSELLPARIMSAMMMMMMVVMIMMRIMSMVMSWKQLRSQSSCAQLNPQMFVSMWLGNTLATTTVRFRWLSFGPIMRPSESIGRLSSPFYPLSLSLSLSRSLWPARGTFRDRDHHWPVINS